MSQPSQPVPPVCPRCRATTVQMRSTSPVAGVWTVYACATCLYHWRSTEPSENTNPDSYPAAFKLEPAQIPGLAVVPAIPPLDPKPA
jgi:vanillate/4-hydroxybenzoate decarboxylase subunit D